MSTATDAVLQGAVAYARERAEQTGRRVCVWQDGRNFLVMFEGKSPTTVAVLICTVGPGGYSDG